MYDFVLDLWFNNFVSALVNQLHMSVSINNLFLLVLFWLLVVLSLFNILGCSVVLLWERFV